MDEAKPYLSDDEKFLAIRQREQAADGRFFFAVSTTGIYCYPSCSARPASRQNILFFLTRAEAEHAGFRPCKRCQPERPPRTIRELDLIVASCRRIVAEPDVPSLGQMAGWAGLSPYHFHRLFRRVTGITPAAYAKIWRRLRVQNNLARGMTITASLYEAGFQSSARFYELTSAILGMKPSTYRAGAPGETIFYILAPYHHGVVLVAKTNQSICAVLQGVDAGLLRQSLYSRFPHACLRPAEAEMKSLVMLCVGAAVALTPVGLPEDIQRLIFQTHLVEGLSLSGYSAAAP